MALAHIGKLHLHPTKLKVIHKSSRSTTNSVKSLRCYRGSCLFQLPQTGQQGYPSGPSSKGKLFSHKATTFFSNSFDKQHINLPMHSYPFKTPHRMASGPRFLASLRGAHSLCSHLKDLSRCKAPALCTCSEVWSKEYTLFPCSEAPGGVRNRHSSHAQGHFLQLLHVYKGRG